eukprot:613999-Pelagomonas_calceolata.AAC.1
MMGYRRVCVLFDSKVSHTNDDMHMTQYPETDRGNTYTNARCPASSIIKDLYRDDKYILIDGDKRASVQPTHG